MLPIGQIARILAQVVVPVVAMVVRALPTAYAEALQNAKKSGTQEVLRRSARTMSKSEALQILNLSESEVAATPQSVQRQYDKYFSANDVSNGGSFYLQSKIFRAKELLDDFIKEKREEEKQRNNDPTDDSTSTTTQPPL